MILGIRSKRTIFVRHASVAIFSALLVYLFYLSYSAWGVERALWPDWSVDHPYWRAWAHAAFVLLFLSLIIGPAAKLWRPMKRFLSWRREFGIWFAVLGIGHAWAIWDRWAQRDLGRAFGFEYMEQAGGLVLTRPEVGIMNMMGVVALPMILLLAITSFDKAVSFLGISSWKWLHSSLIHAIFYILILRGILYFFFFFQISPPNWQDYPSIWFLYVFLGMGVFAVLLQAAAFAKTVLQQRSLAEKNSLASIIAVIGLAVMFAMPMLLATGTVAYFDSKVIQKAPTSAGQAQAPENYARTFYMVVRDQGQDIHIWAKDLGSAPYFRQTIEVQGKVVSHQVYRDDEKTLYSAQSNQAGKLIWTKTENVDPESLGLSGIAAGPGAWAAQYGVGEHQIDTGNGTVQVTIQSTGEVLDAVFTIPENANPVPAN